MSKSEENLSDLCLVCSEFMGGFKQNVEDALNYSNRTILEILESLISLGPIDKTSDQTSICQNCYIKFNELDEHQTIADKIRLDLSYLYDTSHPIHATQATEILKVKIEPIDIQSVENEIYDSDNYNQDNHDDKDDDDDDDDFDDSDDSDSTKPEETKVSPVRSRRLTVNKSQTSPQKYKKLKSSGSSYKFKDENIKEHNLNGQIVFQCTICNKTAQKKGQIRQHIRIHTSKREICCPECGKMFKTPSCLYSHKKIHLKNNRMICDMCGKTFDKKYYLLEHMNAIHLNRREYICTICGLTFARKRSLLKHAWVHSGDTEKKIVCSVCGFKSHTKQGMIRHSKTHTGERNYACEICDKRFACKYNVKAHVNAVHKGIRPKVDEAKLRCNLCGRKFPRQKQLKRHLAEEHNMLQFQNPNHGIIV
ncbi:hypothetical protein ACKWTF_016308 [Chironomus riparius]